MQDDKVVLVYGMGTIGEPLIGLLADFSTDLGLRQVLFHKRTPRTDDIPRILDLQSRGARFVADWERTEAFQAIGLDPEYETEQAIQQAAVVIESTPAGIALKNKEKIYRRHESNTLGFVAQGSEFGFGKMYAYGINDQALQQDQEKYIQVVSCNTHNISILIDTLALEDGRTLLEQGDFVCVRRANDVRNDYDFISAPQVGRHNNPRFGSHHAEDTHHLFETLGHDLNIFSSTMKLNTQYMHTLRFKLKLTRNTDLREVFQKLEDNPLITLTEKTLASQVFSFGRDHGYYGRILNQTVISLPTLQPVVRSLALVHRRDEFRAHAYTVKKLHQLGRRRKLDIYTPYLPESLHGDGVMEAITVKSISGRKGKLPADDVLVMFGFVSNPGPIGTWNLELKRGKIRVNQRMATNIHGIFAAGDVVTYEGKMKLLATGFAEAATALRSSLEFIYPDRKIKTQYSSTTGVPAAL